MFHPFQMMTDSLLRQLATGAAAPLSGMHDFSVYAMLRLRYRKHLMLNSWVRQAPHTEKWASERIHAESWYVAALQGLRTSTLSPSTPGASAEGWTSTSALQHSCQGQGSPTSPTSQTENGITLFVFDCFTQAYHYYFCLSIRDWSGRSWTEWDGGFLNHSGSHGQIANIWRVIEGVEGRMWRMEEWKYPTMQELTRCFDITA